MTGRCCRLDRTRLVLPTIGAHALIRLWLSPVIIDQTRSIALAQLWNISENDRTLHFVRPVVQSTASGHAENIAVTMNSVTDELGHCFAQRTVTAVDACRCLAPDRTRPVTSTGHVSS